jgi:hypothetical protein
MKVSPGGLSEKAVARQRYIRKPYQQYAKMDHNPSGIGSLSRDESSLVQSAERCTTHHPFKEWKAPERKVFIRRTEVKPDNAFAKMFPVPDHIAENDKEVT